MPIMVPIQEECHETRRIDCGVSKSPASTRRVTLSRPRYAIDSYQSTLSGNVQLLTNTSYSVVNLKGSGLGKCEYDFTENQL